MCLCEHGMPKRQCTACELGTRAKRIEELETQFDEARVLLEQVNGGLEVVLMPQQLPHPTLTRLWRATQAFVDKFPRLR